MSSLIDLASEIKYICETISERERKRKKKWKDINLRDDVNDTMLMLTMTMMS